MSCKYPALCERISSSGTACTKNCTVTSWIHVDDSNDATPFAHPVRRNQIFQGEQKGLIKITE